MWPVVSIFLPFDLAEFRLRWIYMSTNDPRISMVIPNYNHAHYLPRCLNAMLNQPVLPYEIIVVDDASTDNSLEVLRSFAERHPIIHVHPNERNVGTNLTVNRGLELAQGDYVGFPAADDEVLPGVFEHFTRILRAHPEAGGCSGLCEWRCTRTGLKWYVGTDMPRQACYLSPRELVDLAKRGRLGIAGQNAVFKKSALLEAGGYIPELKWYADAFCDLTVCFRHGMCHVPKVLSVFYLHPTSYYQSASGQTERRDTMERMLQLLESDRFADVAPLYAESGWLGGYGWQILKLVASHREHRRFLTCAFLRRAIRRTAEVVGRRFFPNWLARRCLQLFYGR